MSRHFIAADDESVISEAEVKVSGLWHKHGNSRVFARVATELDELYGYSKQVRYYDLDTSNRLISCAQLDMCYWNAATQVLMKPEVRTADYCEGIAIHLWPLTIGGWAVNASAQGFLIKPDGGVVDSTVLLERHPQSPLIYRTDTLSRSIYIPLERYSREYIADNWDQIPVSCQTYSGIVRLVETLRTVQKTLEKHANEERLLIST